MLKKACPFPTVGESRPGLRPLCILVPPDMKGLYHVVSRAVHRRMVLGMTRKMGMHKERKNPILARFMNSAPSSIPGFRSLFWNDPIFKRAISLCGFGVMVATGFWWLSQPVPNARVPVDVSMEKKVPPIALAVAALALVAASWRYLQVRKIFTEGTLIRGVVEDLEVETWQTSANMDQSHGSNSRTERSHYATIRYTARGLERKVRQKLPNSGFTFGLKKGGEVELMVTDSQPERPFIRAVYLRR
jgi:hypothetical protein